MYDRIKYMYNLAFGGECGMWTFEEIYNGALDKVPEANKTGVYKVFLPDGFDVLFTSTTDATGDVKNTKPVDELERRWRKIQKSSIEEGKNILYIGQTNESLKTRLKTFARYGYGEVDNHRGGYPIWQIKDNKKLMVEIDPDVGNPVNRETELLDSYIDDHKTQPLANTSVGKGSRYKHVTKTDEYVLK